MTSATFPLSALVAVEGVFPQHFNGSTDSAFTRAMIQFVPADPAAYGEPQAQGQTLSVHSNMALFAIIGLAFGGNSNDFALPNLVKRSVIGGSTVGTGDADSLTLNWLIAPDNGGGRTPPIGSLIPFAGPYCPDGWMLADGKTLSVGQFVDLFFVIGTSFGGDGTNDFILPNLTGATPVGAGQAGATTIAVGESVGGTVKGLGLNFIIATSGNWPSSSGGFPDKDAVLGQVLAYGGSTAPKGWALCDGSLLDILYNQGLFTLLGTTFGGDGVKNFALPDLRGHRVTGS